MTGETIEVHVDGRRLDVTDVEMVTESHDVNGPFATIRHALVDFAAGIGEVSGSFVLMSRKLQLLAREMRRREKRHGRILRFKARRAATLILRSWQREGGKRPGRSHASIVRVVLRELATLDARDGATR